MAFMKKIWKKREVQYPNQRKLLASADPTVVTVQRQEGEIYEVGDAPNADNMNALETRIEAAAKDIKQTGDITYYINNTTGVDSLNTGLSADSPFKTIMKAISLLPSLIDGVITINIADGTYAEDVVINYKTGGIIDINGNATTPTNVKIKSFAFNGMNLRRLKISGFELTTTTTYGVLAIVCENLQISSMVKTNYTGNFPVVYCAAAFATINSSTFSNQVTAITATTNSIVNVSGCTGTANTTAYYVLNGSLLSYAGTVPSGTMTAETTGQFINAIKAADATTWRGWQTFAAVTELGLNAATCTPQQVADALPIKSELICTAPNANFHPVPTYYKLTAQKHATGQTTFELKNVYSDSNDNLKIYSGMYYNDGAAWRYSGIKEMYHNGNYSVVKFISANYTLSDADHGCVLCPNEGVIPNTNITITIPQNLKVDFECAILERLTGSGTTTVAGAAGVGVWSYPNSTRKTLNGNASMAYIKQRNANTFILSGNIKA
jgi:hypothetical protein